MVLKSRSLIPLTSLIVILLAVCLQGLRAQSAAPAASPGTDSVQLDQPAPSVLFEASGGAGWLSGSGWQGYVGSVSGATSAPRPVGGVSVGIRLQRTFVVVEAKVGAGLFAGGWDASNLQASYEMVVLPLSFLGGVRLPVGKSQLAILSGISFQPTLLAVRLDYVAGTTSNTTVLPVGNKVIPARLDIPISVGLDFPTRNRLRLGLSVSYGFPVDAGQVSLPSTYGTADFSSVVVNLQIAIPLRSETETPKPPALRRGPRPVPAAPSSPPPPPASVGPEPIPR